MSSQALDAAMKNVQTPGSEVPEVGAVFKDIDKVEEGKGLKLVLYGKPETGKSYTAMSFPEPIYAIGTEYGIKKLRHHFPDKDIKLMECSVPYAEKPTDRKGNVIDTPFNVDPETSLKQIEAATFALEKIKGGTIILDSVSDVWAWMTLYLGNTGERGVSKKTGEEYIKGSEWSKINEAFRVLVNRLNSLPCHMVLTAREKEYEGEIGIKAGKDIEHFVDLSIHMEKLPKPIPGQEGKYTYVRQATIEKCRYQSVNNLQIQDLTFDKLKDAITGIDPSLENIFDLKPE